MMPDGLPYSTHAFRRGRAAWVGLALIALLALSACAQLQGKRPEPLTPLPSPERVAREERLKALDTAWEQGVRLFLLERYAEAEPLFASLRDQNESAAAASRGRYGMACLYLAKARTRSEWAEAVRLWREWAQAAPVPIPPETAEDPRLLGPVIEAAAAVPELKAREDAQAKEIRRLTEQLQKESKEAETYRQRLKSLEEVHRTLRSTPPDEPAEQAP